MNSDFGGNDAHVWFFAILCWLLWKNRNSFIFQQVANRPEEIVCRVNWFVSNICEPLKNSRSLRVKQGRRVKWCPSSLGWVKVNVDGFSSMNRQWLMVRRVVHDSTGNWLESFRKYIGRGFALKFELWAILVGLEVAWLRNYSKVIVESDSLDAIEMILGNFVNIPSMTIIRRINEFRRKLQ